MMGGSAPFETLGAADAVPDDPSASPGVVAFDFDGTLTTRDSFTTFLKWRAPAGRYRAGMLRLLPAAVAYLGHRSRGRIKAAAAREFLAGLPREALEVEARTFAEAQAGRLMRPDALRAWRYWRSRRATLVIVTASPEDIVAPFARGLAADALIGTRLAYDERGCVTGGFDGPNCRGAEKVKRLQEMFGPHVRLAAAYGDTSGDREMLEIADYAGYREFKESP